MSLPNIFQSQRTFAGGEAFRLMVSARIRYRSCSSETIAPHCIHLRDIQSLNWAKLGRRINITPRQEDTQQAKML